MSSDTTITVPGKWDLAGEEVTVQLVEWGSIARYSVLECAVRADEGETALRCSFKGYEFDPRMHWDSPSPPAWTSETPTVEGWYWVWLAWTEGPIDAERVEHGVVQVRMMHGALWVADAGRRTPLKKWPPWPFAKVLWCGPLAHPPLPKENER